KHGTGDQIPLKGDLGQESADFPLSSVSGAGTEGLRKGPDNRKDDAAGPRRVARHGRGQEEIACQQGIGKALGFFAELFYKQVSDPCAEAGLDESPGNKERDDNQPNGGVLETA